MVQLAHNFQNLVLVRVAVERRFHKSNDLPKTFHGVMDWRADRRLIIKVVRIRFGDSNRSRGCSNERQAGAYLQPGPMQVKAKQINQRIVYPKQSIV